MRSADCMKEKIYYYDPYFIYVLDLNPYDTTRVAERVPDPVSPERGIPVGAIVLWDAHFGPNEGGLSLQKLSENENFKVLRSFYPQEPFTVQGNNYEVHVFQKIK